MTHDTPHAQHKSQFARRYRVVMRFLVRHFYVPTLSFIFNFLLWLGIVAFIFFFSPNNRNDFIKTYLVPHLKAFNLPMFSYENILIDNQHHFIASDIIIHDTTKKKFIAIDTIRIKPHNFFDLSKGFHAIDIGTVTVFKNPIFPASKAKNTDRPEIPKIPFDITNLNIQRLVLKPSFTKQKNDLTFRINAYHAVDKHKIHLNVKSLDYKNANFIADIIQNNAFVTVNSTLKAPAPLVNQFIHNPYFKNNKTVSATINGTINATKYLENNTKAITLDIKTFNIQSDALTLTGLLKTEFYPDKFALKNTKIQLESGKNKLNFNGDITQKTIDGTVQANHFNLVEFYPLIPDLNSLILNGDINIKGNINTIPNMNGTMNVTALYHNVPFNAIITGKHYDTNSTLNITVKTDETRIANADIHLNDTQNGTLDLLVTPQNIPNFFRKDIPVSFYDMTVKTDFNRTNNTIIFNNGHLTLKKLQTKASLSDIQATAENVTLNFSNTPEALHINNASLTALINQEKYDITLENTDLYDYYKPKSLNLAVKNHDETLNLAINHHNGLDSIHLDIQHFNVNKLLKKQIPITITDFNAQFDGYADIFNPNVMQTLTGAFKSDAKHTLDDTHNASVSLAGNITKGVTDANYTMLLNNQPAGTGTFKGSEAFNQLHITTATDLQAINVFIQNTEHRLTGTVTADIALNKGIVSGNIAVQNGTYRNLLHGTALDDITIDTKISSQAIDVVTLKASSFPTGSLQGQGIISLSPNVESSFAITSYDLIPMKNNMVNVKADSQIALTGNINNLKLIGTVKLNDLLILLPDLKANDTPRLNIVRKNNNETPPPTESISLLESIQTDIKVSISEGAKIVGFGLEGFPFGTLNIYGTLGTPKIDGQINIARGKIEILSKNFKIVSGGIDIKKNNPIFNIKAIHRVDDIDIALNLKGAVANPDIVLSSTPAIPKDEIMALLIFGKNKNSLSPFQALRLANTVYQLSRGKSGAGSTFDVIGKTERFLNIDELNVDSGNNNSVNIGAGKYLNDDIYVATDYNPSTADSAFRLELKLSETINLKIRLNTSNNTNNTNNSELMILKKKDY